MLKPELISKLNEQLNLEFYSSNLYLQMSSWCDTKSMTGCAQFLRDHAKEEQEHMERLFDYVNEKGSMAVIGAIDSPPVEYDSVKAMFEQIMEHEQLITAKINELVHLATKLSDFTSINFLQWFVAEQHEEEMLFQGILDRINIIGSEGQALYFIDREVSDIHQKILAKEATE